MAKPTHNESTQFAQLTQLMVTNAEAEPFFDEVAEYASLVCDTPIAIVSLTKEGQQWAKANVGLTNQLALNKSMVFCDEILLQNTLIEINNTSQDDRFKNTPIVISEPYVRFCAGVPLDVQGRLNIGTLCVMSHKPQKLTGDQKASLQKLAKLTSKALLLRGLAINDMENKASILSGIVEFSEDAIISKTLDGIITSWNHAAEKMFGYTQQEMIGSSIIKLFPLDKHYEEEIFMEHIRSNKPIKHYETERLTKDHQRIQISVSLSPIKNGLGEIVGASKIARDITELKQLESALASEHECLNITMNSMGDAVITTDQQGRITHLSPVAETLTGWSNEAASGLPLNKVYNVVHDTTRNPCPNPVDRCLTDNSIIGLSSNTTLISRSGVEYSIEDSAAPIRDKHGNITGVVLAFHDASKQRVLANEVSYRATHDSLTGLINRGEFEVLLKQYINHYQNPDIQSSLMVIDLDQFKVVNTTGGLDAGNQLLEEISEEIKTCLRTSDTFARTGGDEFAIILQKCNAEQSLKIADNIRKAVDRYRFTYNNQTFHIGASIGLVMIDNQWKNTTSLLQAAKHACDDAKNTGRNQVKLHYIDDKDFEIKRNQAHWAHRIDIALEDNQFELFCQRITPLKANELAHIEILLRLKGENDEYISPSLFLPAAERFHMMSRIDRWVVDKSFSWIEQNTKHLTDISSISVNLSGQSLNNKTFHRYIQNKLADATFDQTNICFEITETIAITNIRDTIDFLNLLKQSGVKFSLDDFGSGVSSFGYLKKLPVDYLKIDGQFIKDITENEISQATVRCIVEIAKITNKKTIAEWVESEAIENMLKDMGVDYVQGYFRHIPSPIDAILPGDTAKTNAA